MYYMMVYVYVNSRTVFNATTIGKFAISVHSLSLQPIGILTAFLLLIQLTHVMYQIVCFAYLQIDAPSVQTVFT